MEQALAAGLNQVLSEAGLVAVLLIFGIVYLYLENKTTKKGYADLVDRMVERSEAQTVSLVETVTKNTQVMERVVRKLDDNH